MVDPERQRIAELLSYPAIGESLSPFEQAEFRRLLSRHMPSAARMSWEQLVEAGMFTVGVWVTFEPETLDVPS